MPDTMSMRRWSDVADRVRAWWEIITVVVGAFHVEDARERLAHRREAASSRRRGPRPARRAAVDAVLGPRPRAPVDITARVFTAGVAASCVLTLAIAGARPPTGGTGLYRNLVVFAAVLLLVTFVAHRWGRRSPHVGPAQS